MKFEDGEEPPALGEIELVLQLRRFERPTAA